MPAVDFFDASGNSHRWNWPAGEPIFDLLLKHHVPPLSVMVAADGEPVSEFHRLEAGVKYEVRLLERYDINAIRGLYKPTPESQRAAYEYRRLTFEDGMHEKRECFRSDEVQTYVEDRLVDVVQHYDLIPAESRVLMGFSGGLDSTALLKAFEATAERLPAFDLRAVTIPDFWSDTNEFVKPDLSTGLDVEHECIPLAEIRETFGLAAPIHEVLAELNTQIPRAVHPVANSFYRRVFEKHAERFGIDIICVGDHATDLLAGLLEVFISDPRQVGGIPEREFGELSYIYPVAFHTKRELALYQYAKTGRRVEHDGFNPWDRNTAQRHFFYFLADVLQSYWPGIMHWLASAYDNSVGDSPDDRCGNCGKRKPPTDLRDGRCQVCNILDTHGYLIR